MASRFKQLETVFDLKAEDVPDDTGMDLALIQQNLREVTDLADNIDAQLATKNDIHDKEMDDLAALAIQAHRDLQDLGMNVEIRHAGEIFASSGTMLKIAVDAKNNKVEKKLKMLKLQLDKLKIDRASKGDAADPVEGKATLLDRNELLKQLKDLDSDAK